MTILLMIFLGLVLAPSPAKACSSCAVHYPWIHSFPTDAELEKATIDFLEQYYADNLHENKASSILAMWFYKLKNPGVAEQYNTFEVIISFKEQPTEGDETTTNYHYTSLSYCEDRGFYFWPYLMGSFTHREGLEAYLEEYVIRLPLYSENVELVELKDLSLGYMQPQSPRERLIPRPKLFVLTVAFVALNMVLVTSTVRATKRKLKLKRQKG